MTRGFKSHTVRLKRFKYKRQFSSASHPVRAVCCSSPCGVAGSNKGFCTSGKHAVPDPFHAVSTRARTARIDNPTTAP